MIPFIVADLGNVLGGLFTQFIIRNGTPVPKARKIAVGIFGSLMGFSLIMGPFVIESPATALVILSLAGFGYAAYTANSMAFPGDVVPQSATASVWGIASVGSGLGGAIFQSLSGVTIHNLSNAYNYTLAYDTVFIGYGVLALIGLSIIMFGIGPLVKNPALESYALQRDS